MPRQLIGSNLNTLCDQGRYETDALTWGFNSSDVWRSERSSVYVVEGTYALRCRELQLRAGSRDEVIFYAPTRAKVEFTRAQWAVSSGKKYVAKVKVYTPGDAPYTDFGYELRIWSDQNSIFSTYEQTVKNMGSAIDQWTDVELYFEANASVSSFVASLFLVPVGAGNNYYDPLGHITAEPLGVIFIDKFEVFEYTDVVITPSTLAINKPGSSIVNSNSSTSNNGSITVAITGGAGPFEYSKDNGASWQSGSTFSSLAPGDYTIRVRETLPAYSGYYVFETFTVGTVGAQFTFTTTPTNQQVAGASDGALTINVTGSGSPFEYAIRVQGLTDALVYQSGNTFSNLAPNTYEVFVKDTFGNQSDSIVTILSAIPEPPPEVCTLQFNPAASYSQKATTPQTADGAIYSIANTDPLNTDYHFYEGGASYTNVNGGFSKPWTIAGGRATLGTLSHTQNSDILRQPITLGFRDYTFDWEAYFGGVSQLFFVAFYNSSLVQIGTLLLWDSDNQQGLQRGSYVIPADLAQPTFYIGYYMINQSGADVTGNYLSYFRINNSQLPVKYNLNSDFDYFTQGQITGNFGGLLPGTYTVYARTSASCRATINLTVEAKTTYGIKYRYEFDPYTNIVDTSGGGGINICRIDILEKGYAGAITTITHAEVQPLMLSWENQGGQDPFASVIGAHLTFNLISKTDGQWLEFATTNERKYKAIAYQVMSAGGAGIAPVDIAFTKVFEGFLTPMLYSEPYVKKENYPVTLTFTDGLANLDNIPFSDDGGNFPEGRISMLTAIGFCLNKTGIALDILESVNILASGMSSASNSSALRQAYIDPRTYLSTDGEAESCLAVLRGILESIGCRLYQSLGYWTIDLITQKVASTVLTRYHYNNNGLYNTTGSTNITPRMKLRRAGTPAPKLVFREQSGTFQVAETYGTVEVNYDLKLESEPNLLPATNFDGIDIANGQLDGFAFTSVGNPSVGTEEYEENKRSLYVDFDNTQRLTGITLFSNPVKYFFPGETHFVRISFDVYTRPLFTELPVNVDFMVRLSNTVDGVVYYLQPDNSGNYRYFDTRQTNLIGSKYNRVYITEHLNWKTITVEAYVSQSSFFGELQIEFDLNSNVAYDYNSIADLRSVFTNTDIIKKYNNKARVRNSLLNPGLVDDQLLFYELEAGDFVHKPPEVVRPTNFYGYVWKLKKATPWPTLSGGTIAAESILQSVLIRKVRLEYLPFNKTLRKSIEEIETIDTGVKAVLQKKVRHGDISGIEGNYRYLSTSYISNADGEPLTGWYRRGVNESFTLQKLLAKILRGQYSEQRILLGGQVDTRELKPMFSNTIYELRSGRIFVPLNMSIDFRAGSTQMDMIEVLKGEAVVDEGTPTLPPIEPPVSTREHSDEFAAEFS